MSGGHGPASWVMFVNVVSELRASPFARCAKVAARALR